MGRRENSLQTVSPKTRTQGRRNLRRKSPIRAEKKRRRENSLQTVSPKKRMQGRRRNPMQKSPKRRGRRENSLQTVIRKTMPHRRKIIRWRRKKLTREGKRRGRKTPPKTTRTFEKKISLLCKKIKKTTTTIRIRVEERIR